jgi:aspartate-semialdehyde dehydrogenase
MGRRSASAPGGARVAVVGAATSDGLRLRKQLAELGVPGSRVDLYGTIRGEAVISEYAGEARLIQEPEPGEIHSHDVIFLCEDDQLARGVAADAHPDALVIDLVGALDATDRPPRVHMEINPQTAQNQGKRLAVAHPLAIMLADLIVPLESELGLEEVVAVVLRPAADFGEAGIEELREQTVRLLNFLDVPAQTFGRQLAFNIIPQAGLSCDVPYLEARITRDVTELIGWDRERMTLRLLAVPVFYGHCIQLRLRCGQDAEVSRIEELLTTRAVSLPAQVAEAATPLDVSGERSTRLYEIAEDGLGGFWILAVAGETDGRGAEHAVRLADAVRGL